MKHLQSYLLLLLLMFILGNVTAQNVLIKDKFERTLPTVTLVDWEGYIANPTIKLMIVPEGTASFPMDLTFSVDGARLYFNEPSEVGESGPSKMITLNDANPVSIYLSIFPDEDGEDEKYTLTVSGEGATQEVPIYVIDQDQPDRPLDFEITVDFSEDGTDVTDDPVFREKVIRGVNQWAYFIGDMQLDSVQEGEAMSFIWDDDFSGGRFVENSQAYKGFLVYVHGFNESAELRWGGGGSNVGFQTSNGTELPLRRSGTISVNVSGNRNDLGYNLDVTDETWYIAENLGNQPNDPFSIALHEMGHVLGFQGDDVNPAFTTFQENGALTSDAVTDYQGTSLPIDEFSHFHTTIDTLSKKGAFGYEFANEMPLGRWLSISKVSLLALEAIGYTLRETTPFSVPEVTKENLLAGLLDTLYSDSVVVSGGVPIYYWQLTEGSLPAGLALDSYTGKIAGTPTEAGTFDLVLTVEDHDQQTVTVPVSLVILPGELPAPTALAAEAKSETEVDVSWTLTSEDATFIIIERSLDSLSGYTPIDTVSTEENTFSDQNLTASTKYFYRIRAGIDTILSAYSTIIGVETIGVTGVDDLIADRQFSIYPNPGKNHITISSASHRLHNAQILIFNSSGRAIGFGSMEPTHQGVTLEVGSLPPGAYVVKIITDKVTLHSRLLKD